MNKLRTMLKSPKVRFKTLKEMRDEYGTNWAESMLNIGTEEALHTMSVFSGKPLYKDAIKLISSSRTNPIMLYSEMQLFVHTDMVTTKSLSKYDSGGNVLKPGMLVYVQFINTPVMGTLLGPHFRNESGTIVKVIKVVNPTDLILTDLDTNQKIKLDTLTVATELLQPMSGFLHETIIREKHKFKEGKVCALHIAWHLRLATKEERKEYFSKKQGADLN